MQKLSRLYLLCLQEGYFKTTTVNNNYLCEQVYLAHCNIRIGDQDKARAPHKIDNICHANLREWTMGKR